MKIRGLILFALFFLFTAVSAHGRAGWDESDPGGEKLADQDENKRSMGKVLMILTRDRKKEIPGEMLQAVRSQLSDAPVVFSSRWVDSMPEALPERLELAQGIASKEGGVVAVFWFDLKDADGHVYVAEPESGRVLVRRLEGGSGLATAEAVAIIVRASVMAFLRESRLRERSPQWERSDPGQESEDLFGETGLVEEGAGAKEGEARDLGESYGYGSGVGLEGEETDEGVDEKIVVPRDFRFGLEIGYALDVYATQRPAVHAVSLGLSYRFAKRFHVYGNYRLSLPMQLDDERIRSITRHPASLGVRWQRALDRWTLGIGGGLVMDYTRYKPASVDGVTFSHTRGSVVFSAATFFVAGVKLYDRLKLLAGLGVELGLNNKRYVIHVAGTREVLLEPWPLRPVGNLSLVFEVF